MVQIAIENQTFNFQSIYEAFEFLRKKVEIKSDENLSFDDLDFRELKNSEITPEIKKMADKSFNTPKEDLIRIT
jgi:hypothetical protein